MTNTREMLEASPIAVPLDVGEVAAVIDACSSCVQACTSCADADLAEQEVHELRTCVALCLNCADLCDLTARLLSRSAHWDNVLVHPVLQACRRACTTSAEECARHAEHHRHCAVCEKVCRACVAACSALLDAEVFAEVQRLAGG